MKSRHSVFDTTQNSLLSLRTLDFEKSKFDGKEWDRRPHEEAILAFLVGERRQRKLIEVREAAFGE
jgi:hypothetical protein